ncbi:MAG: hypothetical protein IPN03_09775 [Holophagales bacterium]|nr:hypothetical protein [Holophagales bacterium]
MGATRPAHPREAARFGVAACPDDSCVLFSSFDVDATELMYVERFR